VSRSWMVSAWIAVRSTPPERLRHHVIDKPNLARLPHLADVVGGEAAVSMVVDRPGCGVEKRAVRRPRPDSPTAILPRPASTVPEASVASSTSRTRAGALGLRRRRDREDENDRDKEVRFQGKNRDPGYVQGHIEDYLKNDGFTIQTSKPSPQGAVIQAKKGGFLRG